MTEKEITPKAAREFVDWVKKDMETANNVGPGYMKRLIANYDVLLAEAEGKL